MRPQTSILVAAVIIGATVLWAMGGASETDPYRDVSTLHDDPLTWLDREVSVKGTVQNGTIDTSADIVRFVLVDASGAPEHTNTTMDVVYAGVLPDAFGPKLVVVTGRLVQIPDGAHVFHAEEIQVGCSSKY